LTVSVVRVVGGTVCGVRVAATSVGTCHAVGCSVADCVVPSHGVLRIRRCLTSVACTRSSAVGTPSVRGFRSLTASPYSTSAAGCTVVAGPSVVGVRRYSTACTSAAGCTETASPSVGGVVYAAITVCAGDCAVGSPGVTSLWGYFAVQTRTGVCVRTVVAIPGVGVV
jgi:hypothetical protein